MQTLFGKSADHSWNRLNSDALVVFSRVTMGGGWEEFYSRLSGRSISYRVDGI